MGRYYSGDIEGKFWFGVQSSDDGEFFGAEEQERCEVAYYVDEEKLEHVKAQVQVCLDNLGEYKKKLDDFFEEREKLGRGYNDEMLIKDFHIDKEKVRELLEWYARLILGEKILKHIEEHGSCSFDAEL